MLITNIKHFNAYIKHAYITNLLNNITSRIENIKNNSQLLSPWFVGTTKVFIISSLSSLCLVNDLGLPRKN